MGRKGTAGHSSDRPLIDDAMREKWWKMHLGGYPNETIRIRFGVSTKLIAAHIKARRAALDQAAPVADTVQEVL